MNFQIGDVVMLRSGGPRMTVQAVDGDAIECVFWYLSAPVEETFPADLLKLVERLKSV